MTRPSAYDLAVVRMQLRHLWKHVGRLDRGSLLQVRRSIEAALAKIPDQQEKYQ